MYCAATSGRNSNQANTTARKKKGITPIIAIIVLLLITVTLASFTYNYLMWYMDTLIGKNVQLMDTYCRGGNNGVILVRNIGTKNVQTDEIDIMKDDSAYGGGQWLELTGSTPVSELTVGKVFKFNDTCTDFCRYRFVLQGSVVTTQVQC